MADRPGGSAELVGLLRQARGIKFATPNEVSGDLVADDSGQPGGLSTLPRQKSKAQQGSPQRDVPMCWRLGTMRRWQSRGEARVIAIYVAPSGGADGRSRRARCGREKFRQYVDYLVHRDAKRLGDLLHVLVAERGTDLFRRDRQVRFVFVYPDETCACRPASCSLARIDCSPSLPSTFLTRSGTPTALLRQRDFQLHPLWHRSNSWETFLFPGWQTGIP